jgi:large subunit ribosomal protein L4
MKAQVIRLDASDAGSVELDDAIFGLEPRADILQRMVRYQTLKRQQGTHKTKGRSEVKATSKKMYRQKGTGSARHGNKAAPQFRGGGKAFGPVPRSHAIELPKKVRALALRHALSAKAKTSSIMVIEDLQAAEAKTKTLLAQFAGLGLTSALIIGGAEIDENFRPGRAEHPPGGCAADPGHQRLRHPAPDTLVLTRAAVEAIEERFNGVLSAQPEPYDTIIAPVITESRRWPRSTTRSCSRLRAGRRSRRSRLPSRRCSTSRWAASTRLSARAREALPRHRRAAERYKKGDRDAGGRATRST